MSTKDSAKSVFTKKELRRKNKSSTRGSEKGGTCVASTLDRYFASSSRSYKHPEYEKWLEKTRKFNKA